MSLRLCIAVAISPTTVMSNKSAYQFPMSFLYCQILTNRIDKASRNGAVKMQ